MELSNSRIIKCGLYDVEVGLFDGEVHAAQVEINGIHYDKIFGAFPLGGIRVERGSIPRIPRDLNEAFDRAYTEYRGGMPGTGPDPSA